MYHVPYVCIYVYPRYDFSIIKLHTYMFLVMYMYVQAPYTPALCPCLNDWVGRLGLRGTS